MLSSIENFLGKIGISFNWYKKTTHSTDQKKYYTINNFNFALTPEVSPEVVEVLKLYSEDHSQEKMKRSIHELAMNIQQTVPKERLTPLLPYKSMRAMWALQHVTEKELSEMFIELLTKSADSRYANKVKARYQELLSALDPDDARLLKFIFNKKYVVKIKSTSIEEIVDDETVLKKLKENPQDQLVSLPLDGIPFLEVRNSSNNEFGDYRGIHKIFTDVSILPVGESLRDVEGQFEHLASLGLIDIRLGTLFLPLEVYSHLENNEYILSLEKNVGDKHSIEKMKGQIVLTTLGKDFLSICIKDDKGDSAQ